MCERNYSIFRSFKLTFMQYIPTRSVEKETILDKNIEKEFKVLLTEKEFTYLYDLYPSLDIKKQINTYYDTIDYTIFKSHGAMRIREKDSHFIFTFKKVTNAGLLEYECEVSDNNSKVFMANDIKNLLISYDLQGPFYEVTSLITYRAVFDYGFAELCFDKNEYNGITDFEIEYEYKKEHDGIPFFQKILDNIDVKYEKNCNSKIQRALQSMHNDF